MHDSRVDTTTHDDGAVSRGVFRARPALWALLLFYAAYLASGAVSTGLSLIPGISIIFYPPVGILIATLLLNRKASWPWWIAAGCAAELSCNALVWHNPIEYAALYYTGNALEAVTAAWLIGRFVRKPFRFGSIEQIVSFVVLAAGVAPMVSATVIATTDAFRGKHLFTTAWPLVWLGDATGVLVSVPLVFIAVQAWRGRARIPAASLLEAAAVLGLMVAFGALGFTGHLPSVYLTIPFMMWISARFQMRGAAVAAALLTLVSGVFTAKGYGPFAPPAVPVDAGVIRFHIFLAVSTVSALLIAVLSQQRLKAIADLEAANRDLEMRVAERAQGLRESEMRFRALVNASSDVVYRMNADWSELLFLDGRGFVPDAPEPNRRWVDMYVHPDDRQAVLEAVAKAIGTQTPFEFEHKVNRLGGTLGWTHSRAIPVMGENDEVVEWFGAASDVTDRKELQARSERQFEELENIYASVPVGLAVIDREGRYIRVNERLAEMNGVPAADHVGRTVREIAPALADKAEAVLRRVIETGRPVRDVVVEGETRSQPGVRRAWNEIWSPVRNERGETFAMIVVVDDITERQWAEEFLTEQNRLLEMIAAGDPLNEILTEITAVIGRLEPRTRAAVLVADEERSFFEAAYAADIPDSYTSPLIGVQIEEIPIGTCCKAVYSGEPVTSTDVAGDERWTDAWRGLCLQHGIKACHSEPIFGEDERALGTVVLGFDTPREPGARGLRMAAFGSHVAGIAIERARSEAALRESENDYRTLFESMDEGYCVVELEFDAQERPKDFRFVQINPAFERHSGLPRNAVGERISRLVPDLEGYWLETYGHVALTGEPARFEDQAGPLGRWFEVYAVRVGGAEDRRVGILFSDITERKRREANLDLLASVTDELARDLAVGEIVGTVGRKLAAHLDISDCLFAEIDEQGDKVVIDAAWCSPERRDIAGTYKLSEFVSPPFLEAARRGEAIVSGDTQADERVDADAYRAFRIGAFVSVPFKRAGGWKYLFTVNTAEPREWRDDEVELVKEVTARLFPRIERARAEAAFRVSEERLRLATEAAGIFTWEYDTSTGMTTYSPNVAAVIGFRLPDNTGDANLHIHPHDLERVLGDFAACLEGHPVRTEYRYVDPSNGKVTWVATQGTLIARNGRPARAVGVTQNITERKMAEGTLRAAHDTFRNLVDTSPFGIYAVDADFKLARVSVGAQKVFENVRPLTGRDFAEVLRVVWEEPFATEAINIFRHTLETGEPYHSPRTIEVRGDIGERESYDWRVERIMMPDGRLGVVCHFYDLSERLQYESELREAEQRFRSVFEQAAVGIALLTPEGRWIDVNDRLCGILGFGREELIELSFQEITHGDDLAEDLKQVERALSGGIESYAMNKRYFRKDGRTVWTNLTVSLVREPDGTPKYFISVVEDITERKRVEDALLDSEIRYRRLFETIDEGFCVIEFIDGPHGPLSDYVHIEANPAYTANAGIPHVVGQRVRDMVPDEADGWVEIYRKVLVTGEPVRFERELVATGRHLELAAFRVGTAERRQVAVLFKDITERKQAEAALRSQTELLRGITESTPDLIYAKDASGRMIMANKATLDVYGKTETEVLGNIDSELYDPLEADLSMANDRRVMQSGRTETIEEVITTVDGKRTFLTTKNPLRAPDGRVVGIVGVSHDITALKRAEKALRDSEARHRLALEAGAMGTWTWPLKGRDCWADERALNLFDIDPAEWNGDAALLIARRHPDDAAAVDRSIVQAIAGRSTWRAEFRIARRDGTVRWLAGAGRIEFDRRGEPVLMRGISFDITERKIAEEELRGYHETLETTVLDRTRELADANRELLSENRQRRLVEEERQRLLRQLVAAQEEERRRIAQDLHDHLGQQLTALNFKLELALQDARDGAAGHLVEARAMMRRIDEDVDALAWQLRPAMLDDDGFLPALRRYVEDWSVRCGVPAAFWADEHLDRRGVLTPEAETNLYRITQEALNNIAKYASASRVEVLLNRRGDTAVLTVQDDGVGFDTAARSNTRSMGLIGMRERAGIVGGNFQLESSPGEGTAVFVSVPFAADGSGGAAGRG